jgi:hypothetical protein
MTNHGREIMAQLISWETIDDVVSDVSHTEKRVRYIHFGSDHHPETPSVLKLKAPLTATAGGQHTLALQEQYTKFLNATSVRFERRVATNQLSHTSPVVVKEMGLIMARRPGEDFNQWNPLQDVSFYKAVPEGILKLPTMELWVTWELRF